MALVPLLFVLRGVTARKAALCGLVCGLVHFTSLLYWIVIVLGKYGGLAWFISIPALLLLALYMSLYFALFALLARFILLAFPAAVSLWLLPALWVGIDWFRGLSFYRFSLDGSGLCTSIRYPFCIQIADLAGHHGVTFLVVLVNTCLMLTCNVQKSILVPGYLLILVPTVCLSWCCSHLFEKPVGGSAADNICP